MLDFSVDEAGELPVPVLVQYQVPVPVPTAWAYQSTPSKNLYFPHKRDFKTMSHQDMLEILSQHELEEVDDDDSDDSSFEDESDYDSSEGEDDIEKGQHLKVKKTQMKRQLFLSRAMHNLLRGAVSSTGDLPSMMAPTSVHPISRVGSDTAINRIGDILYHVQTASAVALKDDQRKPIQLLRDILREAFCIRSYRDYDFWAPWNSDGYTIELTSAVRQHDLEKIKEIAVKGHNLQCTNKFGESVVHTAARRGALDILSFFVEQSLSLRVCCEQGRNPLHDACWTGRPDFEVVKLLLEYEVRFLLAADKRGLIPLEYIPNAAWREWENFLNENRDIFLKY
ncbi:hypothetical protein FisN_16Lh146 [Fistulifera solaris]|uniref:Uncharacterized protein n=1 Tax=Fistulifera solaris TaxID=1519565 RepID=A0A1Z5KK52_FISSO|nr:hypothetical protein FisN_16Lh146 [Fistulifera solaris]|eukprot:GAX26308.1 hypothetical protein FisN_16Lh146 [Fistulifera solaris]